jgi:hypothetical protein
VVKRIGEIDGENVRHSHACTVIYISHFYRRSPRGVIAGQPKETTGDVSAVKRPQTTKVLRASQFLDKLVETKAQLYRTWRYCPAKREKKMKEFSECRNARWLIVRKRKHALVEESTDENPAFGRGAKKLNKSFTPLQLLRITPLPGSQ